MAAEQEFEHNAHQREEDRLHKEHEAEELRAHKAHEKEEAEAHEEHVHEEEELHREHVREEEHEPPEVKITVNNKTVEIARGPEPVAVIKEKGGVPAGYVLVQVIDKRDVPLKDDADVCIKGGEVFDSHAPEGGSS